ncbi:MAG: M20 family metallopeptidase [Chitinophagales bacterium]
MLKEEIKQLAGEKYDQAVANRRYLHSNPELSFQEYETSSFVKARLDELGIPWQTIAGTGIIAIIKGEIPSDQVIALRADMDALPINEVNSVAYASQNKGVMHACGHDAHTASLLGTAGVLQALKSKFAGSIKLLFQPGEEKLPGGASLMIKEGALKSPCPRAVIGQHVMPAIACGKIGLRKGKHMASMDEIYVTVYGKGGHGAQPHQNIDPVIISAHILIALQQLVSRMADPKTASVLSFGKVIANGAVNIIPDEVYMEGTFRTLDESWRTEAHQRMRKMAEGIAESMGGQCHFNIVRGYPVLFNDPKLAEQVADFAGDYLGKENVLDEDIWMASEDFAYYSQEVSSCFYLLGVGNSEKGITASLHTPTFNIDEQALEISIGLMAYIALKFLGN